MAAAAMTQPEPALNLGSPRVRAAMRVLGVRPQDVRKLDPSQFVGDEAHLKVLELKRRHIIEEVNSMASKGPEAQGHKGGDAGQSRAEMNAAFLKEVERAEKENMERMQKMAKKDVQKVVIEELETKLNAFKGKKKQEESHTRLRELLKARDDQLALRKKEAAKRQEKNQEVRERAERAKSEKVAEITEQLRKANERAESQIAQIAAGREESVVKTAEKRVLIFERQEGFERELLRGREGAYREHCDRHQAKLDKLAEKLAERQSNAEAIAEKQRECMDNVRKHQEKKQADAETKYHEICERHAAAATKRDDTLASLIKNYQVRNTKRRSAHENRYGRLMEEWEQHVAKMQAWSAPGSPHEKGSDGKRETPKASTARDGIMARSSSDSKLLEVFEHRRHLVEIAASNRERLRRAHHYSVEQQVDKLDQMRKKVQIMEDAKAEADRRRMVVMRNCAVQKMHLSDRVDRIKDSQDPEKMNRMLEDLDPEPDAVARINDLLRQLGMERMGGLLREETEASK